MGNRGFSLIELMVVVGMVGILAAMAVMNYFDFVKRAKVSEAKAALSTLYSTEMVYRAEYKAFTTVFNAMGYKLHGNVSFNVGFDNDFLPIPPAPAGTPACKKLCPETLCAAVGQWRCMDSAQFGLDGTVSGFATLNTFRATAHAHFSPDDRDWHTLTIDQNKRIVNVIPAN